MREMGGGQERREGGREGGRKKDKKDGKKIGRNMIRFLLVEKITANSLRDCRSVYKKSYLT